MIGLITPNLWSQDDDDFDFEGDIVIDKDVFYDTRVINGHSVETLDKNQLDFRIVHRFGTIATPAAPRSLFGLDNSSDIRIAFEYGLTDKLMIGAGRSKGHNPLKELWDGLVKYKILQQTSDMPISLTASSSMFFTSMKADQGLVNPTSFTKDAHRFSYYTQIMIGKNFGDHASIQIAPGIMYRNFVPFEDQNLIPCLGLTGKVKVYKKISLVAEYYAVFRENNTPLFTEYVNPLALGIEFKTYSHIFQLNFINSGGIGEGQFIPFTSSKWSDGAFRFGFTIARQFQLGK